MERIYIKDLFELKEGDKVLLKGWVHDTRDLKKVRFLVLKDISGRVQVTGVESKTDKDTFELLDNLKRESAVEIEGEVKESKQAPGGKEVLPSKIIVVAEAADSLPIDVSDFSKTELPLRLDNRFLDLHSQKAQAIFKVQSTIMQAYREFMVKEGAIEAVFPSVIGSSSEGGTEVYKMKYFEKEAYLSQSCQLYKQQVACSMEKVFSIFTVWRAEKHNTTQHLNESRQLDYEAAFSTSKEAMDVLGRAIKYIVEKVIEINKDDLDKLNIELKVPEIKYIAFSEVSKIMKENKISMQKHDLTKDAEKKLGELYPDTVVFVTDWPAEGRGFYIMPKDQDPEAELTEGFDAIYQGVEISSGGQRVHIPELLEKLLEKKGLNPSQFEGYINSFKYGAPYHAGWGVGLERVTMLLLGLENIREATMWPRDRERLTP